MAIWGLLFSSLSGLLTFGGESVQLALAASDSTKPSVIIERPWEGQSLYAGTIYVSGKASDAGSGVDIVEVKVDNQRYKPASPASPSDWSTWSTTFSLTSSGSHTIRAKAIDRSGNADWETVTFKIVTGSGSDTSAPIVAITSPSNGATIEVKSGDKLTIRGTASDAGSGIKAVDIRLVDNAYVPATPKAPGDWSTWSAAFSITPGDHRFIARATDNAGNQEWANLDIIVREPTEPVPPPPPSSGEDKFGVVKIYQDSTSRPDSWFMDMDNPNVNRKRFDVREDSSITKNSDGSWKIRDTQIRMNVYNKNGYSSSKIPTYDRDVLTQKGYMQDSDDWKNVELTMFVKLNSFSGNAYFSPYARSGWHSHGTAPNGENIECEGSGVKPRIYFDGQVAEAKEMWHNEGYAVRDRHDVASDLQGRWIGIKTVIYDVPLSGGGVGVRQELWINESGDPGSLSNWKKVIDGTDSGGWGTNGDAINCESSRPDQPIFWGGPVATYRWDNANNVDFKWLSIREIQPAA